MKGNSELKVGFGIAVVVILILLLINSVVIMPTGNIGVVTQVGAVTGRVVTQGMSIKMPLIQGITKMSIRTQKYQADKLKRYYHHSY
jgi:prohibitin 2